MSPKDSKVTSRPSCRDAAPGATAARRPQQLKQHGAAQQRRGAASVSMVKFIIGACALNGAR